MKFYFLNYPNQIEKKKENADVPCVFLVDDNWDDYGFETLFHAYFCDRNREIIELESVKILDKRTKITKLEKEFNKLNENYCSLGTNLDYYDILKKLGGKIYEEILYGLNDAAFQSEIGEKFSNLEGFQKSLLRYTSSRKTYEKAKEMFNDNIIKANIHISSTIKGRINIISNKNYNFNYKFKIPEAESAHIIDFNFVYDKYLPFRTFVLIGKNGTGKTKILSTLAKDLSGEYNDSEGKFKPKMPKFSKILAISYSAFDKFEKSNEGKEKNLSYLHFGIIDDKGEVNYEEMNIKLRKSISRLKKLDRIDEWKNSLEEIGNKNLLGKIYNSIVKKNSFEILDSLSSGQRMIVEIISNIIANIQEETLILFDEPEIHLHPNAIAVLTKILNKILSKFNSYSIIATHSPLIIQQTPAKYIRIIKRFDGNIPDVQKMKIESFGENLTTITNEIFNTIDVDDNYKNVLEKLAQNMDYKDILNKFENKLSFNAKIYLKSLSKNNLE